MNKRVLRLSLLLAIVVMFTTPLVGSVQAWGWRCNRGCPQDYMVTVAPAWGGYELLDYKFIPSETDPCMAIFKWKEALKPVGNDITVGDNTYSLGAHFEYSGKMVVIVNEPFPPFSAPARPFLAWGERVIWMFWYQYDFSAVSGGLDGKINMFAYVDFDGSDPAPSMVRSIWGTGDFRCVKIDAIIDTAAGGAHVGTVTGWPE